MNTHPLNVLLDTIDDTVIEHSALVTRARAEHPSHETLLLSLQNQLERHIGFIVANLESYTSIQRDIIVALQQGRIEATAQSAPCLTASSISTDTVPTSPWDTESGRFPFYAVRKGRQTVFYSWTGCHRATHRTANEYCGFHTLAEAFEYLNLAPLPH
jgi:hypothetical protein